MLNVRPSNVIRKNYSEISELCKSSGGSVCLTKNGIGDFVVMDIESFAWRESALKLKEKLLQSEIDIQAGRTYTVDEAVAGLRNAVKESANVRQR
jgi:7-keto-8-aminopelargonate synthetase-like enzyme